MNKSIFLLIILFIFSMYRADADTIQSSNIQCEDTCDHVHGIDLSHYQGTVFWDAIGENSDMAHRYGLKVGSYHFFRPKSDLHQQLYNFMSQCQPGNQDLIPMIDIETKSDLPTEEFQDSLLKFLDMVEKTYRQKPLLYTFANFYDHYLSGKIDDYNLMIAQYTKREPVLADGKDICLWQYTGKGHINGINNYVDKSRFMGRHGMKEIRYHH